MVCHLILDCNRKIFIGKLEQSMCLWRRPDPCMLNINSSIDNDGLFSENIFVVVVDVIIIASFFVVGVVAIHSNLNEILKIAWSVYSSEHVKQTTNNIQIRRHTDSKIMHTKKRRKKPTTTTGRWGREKQLKRNISLKYD